MATADIGESLVGAYMRHVERCSIVLYNSFFAEQQGEVDVVAVKRGNPDEPRTVYLCEVTTHIGGMAAPTVARIPGKLGRLREFAKLTFPGDRHRFQWWSPYVPEGATTELFARLCAEWPAQEESLEFVINSDYTRRIVSLVDHARASPSATNEPAFRLLQILTRLRGEKPQL